MQAISIILSDTEDSPQMSHVFYGMRDGKDVFSRDFKTIMQPLLSEVNVNELIEGLKNKDLQSVRKWIVNNLDNDHNRIFRTIYDTLLIHLSDDTSIKYAVHTIGEYQYKAAFVADQEINLLACMIVLMSEVKFK